MSRVPMTQEAYNRRIAEIEHLENTEMPKIAEKIAAARDEGDLKENAEYHAQREAQGQLKAKIDNLKSSLANATIIDTSKIPKDQVAFGATVRVLDLKYDDEEVITLVGEGDENYDEGKFKITSPFGQALLGKKVDEIAEFEVPAGPVKYKVLEIRYD